MEDEINLSWVLVTVRTFSRNPELFDRWFDSGDGKICIMGASKEAYHWFESLTKEDKHHYVRLLYFSKVFGLSHEWVLCGDRADGFQAEDGGSWKPADCVDALESHGSEDSMKLAEALRQNMAWWGGKWPHPSLCRPKGYLATPGGFRMPLDEICSRLIPEQPEDTYPVLDGYLRLAKVLGLGLETGEALSNCSWLMSREPIPTEYLIRISGMFGIHKSWLLTPHTGGYIPHEEGTQTNFMLTPDGNGIIYRVTDKPEDAPDAVHVSSLGMIMYKLLFGNKFLFGEDGCEHEDHG